MGGDFQEARQDHSSRHDRQLWSMVARPAAKLGIARCTRHPGRGFCPLIPSIIRKRCYPSYRGCHLASFMSANRRQGEHSSIRACTHPIPVRLPVNPTKLYTCANNTSVSFEMLAPKSWVFTTPSSSKPPTGRK